MFVISSFIPPKMAPAGAKSTREKYGAFLNSNDDFDRLKIELVNTECLSYLFKHV